MRKPPFTIYRNLIFAVGLLLVFGQAGAQSISFSGTVANNTTWDYDTVYITGNVTVPDSVTLTIMPGTIVYFSLQRRMNVYGILHALGTAENKIIFTAPSAYYWYGLYFIKTRPLNDTNKLIFCDFSNMKTPNNSNPSVIYIDSCKNIFISNTKVHDNLPDMGDGAGIFCINSQNITIINCDIYNNRYYGIYIAVCDSFFIINSYIHKNFGNAEGTGIHVSSSKVHLINSIISENYYKKFGPTSSMVGGGLYISYSEIKMINTIIAYNNIIDTITNILNFGGGFYSRHSKIDISNSNIWGNRAYYGNQINTAYDTINIRYSCFDLFPSAFASGTVNDTIGNSIINMSNISYADPQFSGNSGAPYRTDAFSPCFNAGNPSHTIDSIGWPLDIMRLSRIEGGRVDIGAYEYHYGILNNLSAMDTLVDENYDSLLINLDECFDYQYGNTYIDYEIFLGTTQHYGNYLINNRTLKCYSQPDIFGQDTIIIRANDGIGSVAFDTFYLEINNIPEFTSTPVTVAYIDSVYQYQITAVDEDGDSLWFTTQIPLPAWLQLENMANGSASLSGTPNANNQDTTISILLNDGRGQQNITQQYLLNITQINIAEYADNAVLIFPNPVTEFISIKGIKEDCNILLFDGNGKKIKEWNLLNDEIINLSSVPEGTYVMQIITPTKKILKKIIKQ